MTALEAATFTNRFVDALPGDTSGSNRQRQVRDVFYSAVAPTPVANPRLLAWSDELGEFLGLQRPAERGAAVDLLAGNRVAESMKPFAARYGGHQFGGWAGQLGDGRAISLGEVTASDGARWEIQLKGAGLTPYSRRGDGRAVLRSSLREFACSEAMHWLGVPTTRALSLVETGDTVIRDMFYNGNPQPEKGAIAARVAPSFVRFGNFEILTAAGELENLKTLADFVIQQYYPELGEPGPAAYVQWFQEVCRRTAVMIAQWMTVGFVHGVMNTDNMSILGLTIDYGPYGWLEPYDPEWTPNTTDFGQRRYAFGQQPAVALWNLSMLARAILPLVPESGDAPAGQGLVAGFDIYRATYAATYREFMLRKLGLQAGEDDADLQLLEELQLALATAQVDMTLFFRSLSHASASLLTGESPADTVFDAVINACAYPGEGGGTEPLHTWLRTYADRLAHEGQPAAEVKRSMLASNPKYVLRNYLAQQAIEAADAGDLAPLERLMLVLKRPFDEQPEHDELARKRPDWARDRPGCATLSCSS